MHPERPERVSVVMARLSASGLTQRCAALPCRQVQWRLLGDMLLSCVMMP